MGILNVKMRRENDKFSVVPELLTYFIGRWIWRLIVYFEAVH